MNHGRDTMSGSPHALVRLLRHIRLLRASIRLRAARPRIRLPADCTKRSTSKATGRPTIMGYGL